MSTELKNSRYNLDEINIVERMMMDVIVDQQPLDLSKDKQDGSCLVDTDELVSGLRKVIEESLEKGIMLKTIKDTFVTASNYGRTVSEKTLIVLFSEMEEDENQNIH